MHSRRPKPDLDNRTLTLRWGAAVVILLFVVSSVWKAASVWDTLNSRITALEQTQAWQAKALHNLHQDAPKGASVH